MFLSVAFILTCTLCNQEKNHFTIFDMVYQGFATGDLDTDAGAVRYFAERGLEFLCGQSFAKTFCLYSKSPNIYLNS